MVTKPGFMHKALRMAHEGGHMGEVPVGAVVVLDGVIIGTGINSTRSAHDPAGHAEIVALRQAAEHLGSARLSECDLWVTLEPCTMCAGAISHARIKRLYYGARDPKGGAVDSGVRFFNAPTCLHAPEVYSGICEGECAALLTEFFAARRD